jgi:hypothetical protein
VTSIPPDNLTTAVFRALYPEYELTTVGSTYIVYPPSLPGRPLILISDSLGAIARQISEHDEFDWPTVAEDATGPLPHRNHP